MSSSFPPSTSSPHMHAPPQSSHYYDQPAHTLHSLAHGHHYNMGFPLQYQSIASSGSSSSSSSSSLNSSQNGLDKLVQRGEDDRRVSTYVQDDSDEDDGNDLNPNKRKSRRANQNIASRNYRQRKKEYVKELEARMTVLTLENEQLKKEISVLKESAVPRDFFEQLKPDPSVYAMHMEIDHVVKKLEELLNVDSNGYKKPTPPVDEANRPPPEELEKQIAYLMHMAAVGFSKRRVHVERDVEKIINPFTQAKLAVMGYVPALEHPGIGALAGAAGDMWWNRFFEAANVSAEQQDKIQALRRNHHCMDALLRQQRVKLDHDIKEFFMHKLSLMPTYPRVDQDVDLDVPPVASSNGVLEANKRPVEMADLVNFVRQLDALRKTYTGQYSLLWESHELLGQILLPRQEAILMIRLHKHQRYDVANVEVLRNMWRSLMSAESPTPSTSSVPHLNLSSLSAAAHEASLANNTNNGSNGSMSYAMPTNGTSNKGPSRDKPHLPSMQVPHITSPSPNPSSSSSAAVSPAQWSPPVAALMSLSSGLIPPISDLSAGRMPPITPPPQQQQQQPTKMDSPSPSPSSMPLSSSQTIQSQLPLPHASSPGQKKK
eukprot:TRINITY_DN3020_c0_g1_i1.p1 TRINITY_DN3020_c0_g1~~TRINITY_DN3020_c0_g1_i1.p1  ORF type:complete len:602 (+),score=224.21 TRINITY_DN3020_c0_g1_i1:154-1959(+)